MASLPLVVRLLATPCVAVLTLRRSSFGFGVGRDVPRAPIAAKRKQGSLPSPHRRRRRGDVLGCGAARPLRRILHRPLGSS